MDLNLFSQLLSSSCPTREGLINELSLLVKDFKSGELQLHPDEVYSRLRPFDGECEFGLCQKLQWDVTEHINMLGVPIHQPLSEFHNFVTWIVFTPENLEFLKEWVADSDVLDLGAGLGYVSHYLSEVAQSVEAVDVVTPERSFYPITKGNVNSLAKHHDVLCMSYPPSRTWDEQSGMGLEAVERAVLLNTQTILYIGENPSSDPGSIGCTGTVEMFAMLWRYFELKAKQSVWNAPHTYAQIHVFRRRKVCNLCGRPSHKRCSCGVPYCRTECQRKDWPKHREYHGPSSNAKP